MRSHISGIALCLWTAGCSLAAAPSTDVCCTTETAGLNASSIDWFTNFGNYMPRVECLRGSDGRPDWPWISAIIILTSGVIAGYLRMVVFWRHSYLAEAPQDRNRKLMDLAWIFILCATCGYAMSILMFFWPAYRLLAIFLVALNVVTWRFIVTLGDFRASFQTHRLRRQLDETLAIRNAELESLVALRTRELATAVARADAMASHAQRLMEQSRRLAMVAERTSNAVVIADVNRKVVWVNEGFTRVTGYTLAEVVGRSPGPLLQFEKTDPEQLRILRAALHARVPFRGELLNRAKDGREYWMALDIQPLNDDDGNHNGFMAIETDITALKEQEQELVKARHQADLANRSKSEFLANMSHEIRTPMTAILGYTDLLAEEGDIHRAPQRRVEYIETIRRNGDHLLSIINDILDISKIEAGRMDIEAIATEPRQIVADVMSLMLVKAEAKGLTLSAQALTPIPARITSDPVRLRQILVNLVGNAIKFTEVGSVNLLLACDREDVSRLRFEVHDTGIGLTEEQLTRLFGAFVQADTTTTRRFGGTGLGLRISKRLAEMLGGDIAVTSVPGKGSVFTLTIATGATAGVEMIEAGAALVSAGDEITHLRTGHEAPPADSPLRGIRILLAEDGIDNQRLISHHLRRAGADVQVAADGRRAVEMFTSEGTVHAPLKQPVPFDLFLTDMQMPEMDGYSAVTLLRRKGLTIPIVAITAHAMAGDADRCREAGCDSYCTKPIDRIGLIETCRRLFGEAVRRAAA